MVFSINANYFLDFFNKGLTSHLIFTKNLLIIFYALPALENLRITSILFITDALSTMLRLLREESDEASWLI